MSNPLSIALQSVVTGETPSLSAAANAVGLGPLLEQFNSIKERFEKFKTDIQSVSSVLTNVSGQIQAAQVQVASDVGKMVDEGVKKAVLDSTAAAELAAKATVNATAKATGVLSTNPSDPAMTDPYGEGEGDLYGDTTGNVYGGTLEGGRRVKRSSSLYKYKKDTYRKKKTKRSKTRSRRY